MKLYKFCVLIVILVLWSCAPEKYEDLDDGIFADIQTSVGDVLVKLEYKDVPMTVGNFISLAEGTNPRVTDSIKGKPFYDGLIFYNVVSVANGDRGDFMLQSGCPLGNGFSNPGYFFPDEFPKDNNGDLKLTHDSEGMISMANSGKDNNGSHFFINLVPTPHQNGVHTVFGKVVRGFDIAKNSIVVNSKINHIDIIRVGRDAKKFDAVKAFEKGLKSNQVALGELASKKEQLRLDFMKKIKEIESEAEELPSDLKIYFTKRGDGPKPNIGSDIRFHYTVYFADGTFLATNRKEVAKKYDIYDVKRDKRGGYEPMVSVYSMEAELVQGFKEGLQKMQFGDKTILFVPWYLGYGEQASRGIPAKSDLIFELEMYPKN